VKSVRGNQLRLALMLGVAVCVTFALAVVGARFTSVIPDHVDRQIAKHKADNGLYVYNQGYFDGGDYVLIDKIPNADYSRGGVYFIGASEMQMTLMPWRLSAEENALIHNYSIGDFRHRDVYHFVRMLVEEAGLLQAGGERTTIYLGLSTEMAREQTPGYVESLFERHGFYSYEWSEEMSMSAMPRLQRDHRLRRNEANRFLSILLLSRNEVGPVRLIEQRPEHQVRPNWRPAMEEEVPYLAQAIDYLQARGVTVAGIYPPQASWRDHVDYSGRYFDMVSETLAARGVPLIDQRDLLMDDEFSDAVHPVYEGHAKLHDAYLELARHSLEEMRPSQ
jgi:hypothetical protein